MKSTPVRCVLVLCLLPLACTPEPLEFADWTIPVPEGTPIIEYEAVPMEERTERIELVEDLVIGRDTQDPNYSFYRPRSVAVDDAGHIYVADAGDHQVKVYDEKGNHLLNLGREGQGPGEFVGPFFATFAGSTLVVADTRLSLWDSSGKHLGDKIVGANTLWGMAGRADGSFVVRYSGFDALGHQVEVIERWDSEVQVLGQYPVLRDARSLYYPSEDVRPRVSISVGTPVPAFASGLEGPVYLTPSEMNQVFAFDAAGKMVWALRVASPRQPLARSEVEGAMNRVRSRFPEAKESEIDWPEYEPALGQLWVDGHGHLYVFSYLTPGTEPRDQRVDVYSANGERLFAGLITSTIWLEAGHFATHGDHVYDVRRDWTTGEEQIARYRLVEPF